MSSLMEHLYSSIGEVTPAILAEKISFTGRENPEVTLDKEMFRRCKQLMKEGCCLGGKLDLKIDENTIAAVAAEPRGANTVVRAREDLWPRDCYEI